MQSLRWVYLCFVCTDASYPCLDGMPICPDPAARKYALLNPDFCHRSNTSDDSRHNSIWTLFLSYFPIDGPFQTLAVQLCSTQQMAEWGEYERWSVEGREDERREEGRKHECEQCKRWGLKEGNEVEKLEEWGDEEWNKIWENEKKQKKYEEERNERNY
jgi:hypothetical protein